MKKKILPLYADTLFLFFCSFLFFFCVFRFYLRSFWAAGGMGLAAGLAAAALFFFLRRARYRKKYRGFIEKDEAEKFRFHLAALPTQECTALIAECLAREESDAEEGTQIRTDIPDAPTASTDGAAEKNRTAARHADNSRMPPAADRQTTAQSAKSLTEVHFSESLTAACPVDYQDTAHPAKIQTAPHTAAEDGTKEQVFATKMQGRTIEICNNEVRTPMRRAWVLFAFRDASADDIAPALRAEGERREVYACGFTEEAKKLADAFGVKLCDAADTFALAKRCGCLPAEYFCPPAAKGSLREKLRFRIRREAWRGYLFSGCFLLVFSLMTIFPVYYIVSGGLLLTIAVLVRLFGKPDRQSK